MLQLNYYCGFELTELGSNFLRIVDETVGGPNSTEKKFSAL